MLKVEKFRNDVPLDRLARELTGRAVVIELLLIDNAPPNLEGSEARYLERFPTRQPEAAGEIKGFAQLLAFLLEGATIVALLFALLFKLL